MLKAVKQFFAYERPVLRGVGEVAKGEFQKALKKSGESLLKVSLVALISGTSIFAGQIMLGVLLPIAIIVGWLVLVYISTPARLHFAAQEKIANLQSSLHIKTVMGSHASRADELLGAGQQLLKERVIGKTEWFMWVHERMPKWEAEVVNHLEGIDRGVSTEFRVAGTGLRPWNVMLDESEQYARARDVLVAKVSALGEACEALHRAASLALGYYQVKKG